MKISAFLLFCCLVNIFAAPTYSQATKISLNLKDATIEDVLNKIEDVSEFYFLYNNKLIDVTRKVNIEADKEPIKDILNDILSKDTKFIVYDRQIILTPGDVTSLAEALQQLKVTGTVIGKDGTPLPGVNVVVTGTTQGAITDIDGKYTIQIPQGSKSLTFSFIGMESQEISIGTLTQINVTMAESAFGLDEVVVVGYGTQKRKSITGATNIINSDDIKNLPVNNISLALQGRVPGVEIGSSGNPSSGAVVRIRGINSFNSGNDPLYIVDGLPYQGSINSIDPSDMESITVLKDGTSASIYGARAAGGVIIITTKKGKMNQKPKITFDSYFGYHIADNLPQMVNTQQFANSIWLSREASGLVTQHPQFGNGAVPVIPDFVSPVGSFIGDPLTDIKDYDLINNQIMRTGDTKWFDEITQPGLAQNYHLALTGSGKESQYGMSFSYLNRQGSIIYTGFQRFNVKVNSEFSLLNSRIRIGENIIISNSKYTGGSGEGAVNLAYLMPPAIPVYDIAGNFAGTRGGALGLGTNFNNPVAVLFRSKDNSNNSLNILGNAYVAIEIFKGLSAKTNIGISYDMGNSNSFNPKNPEQLGANAINSLSVGAGWGNTWTWTNTLEYSKIIANNHTVGLLLGTEAVKTMSEGFSASRSDFFTEDIFFRYLVASSGAQTNSGDTPNLLKLASVFGKFDYGFKDKYFLSATIRRDGSTRFGENNRYGTFSSAGFAWQISDESFLKNNSIINSLRLKTSIGNVGNQNAIGQYLASDLYAPNIDYGSYDINATNTKMAEGIIKTNNGNPNVKWETSSSFNLGMEGILFHKLDFSFNWYRKITKDALVPQGSLPLAAGVTPPPTVNLGKIQNKGIEISIGYKEKIGEFSIDALGMISAFRNKVINIDGNPNTVFLGPTWYGGIRASRIVIDQPISVFYGFIEDGVVQDGSDAGNFNFRDLNGDGKITLDDQTFIGKPQPDFSYSLNLNLSYKNFDLLASFNGVEGNDIWNFNKWAIDFDTRANFTRSTRVITDAWTPENHSNKLAQYNALSAAYNFQASTYYVENGSFLKLRDLQIGYTFRKLKVFDKLRIYVQAENLFTLTKYLGFDPEVYLSNGNSSEMGVDIGNIYPVSKFYMAGINVEF